MSGSGQPSERSGHVSSKATMTSMSSSVPSCSARSAVANSISAARSGEITGRSGAEAPSPIPSFGSMGIGSSLAGLDAAFVAGSSIGVSSPVESSSAAAQAPSTSAAAVIEMKMRFTGLLPVWCLSDAHDACGVPTVTWIAQKAPKPAGSISALTPTASDRAAS